MKHFLSFCFAIICVSRVWAYDALIDGIYYNLNSTDLTAEVTNETGDYNAKSYSGSVIIPASITSNSQTYSVTTIGWDAFCGCYGLTSVTIPNSVTTIGNSAFGGCSGLTSVTIPNSVTMIGNNAFYGCSSLTSVKWNAKNCSYIPTDVNSPFGSQVETFILGDSVQVIPNFICSNMRKLTSIIIPNSVTTIGERAFSDCSALISVTIPNSVTTIGWYAFCNCNHLTSVIIPNSVTTIERGAFYYCSRLTSITIPNSVTTIGDYAFYYCSSLTSVIIEATTPPALGEKYVFPSSCKFYIPCGTESVYYKSEGWKDYNLLAPGPNYQLTVSAEAYGIVQIITPLTCSNDTAIIFATPNYGYYFTQWSDGNTDNPRTIVVTQDTVIEALFAISYSGKCGDNLYWQYSNGTLNITGSGAMYDGQPWFLFRDSITKISLPAQLTTIGDSAFVNIIQLNSITIPSMVTTMGINAFSGCRKLYDIYCLAAEPPVAQTSSFANYNVYLHVPCDNLRDYQMDAVFGSFKYVECISAEQTQTDDHVTVTPSDYNATFTWPQNDQAAGYSIEITKDGVVFCTLKFNAQGQLTGIAFAPSRDGARGMASATMTANGWQFTVTGLSQASKYGYTLDALNASQQSIKHYQGEFYTDGYTDLDQLADSPTPRFTKIIKDNQLLIRHNGKLYNALGF